MKSLIAAFIEIRFPRLWMPAALYIPMGLVLSAVSLAFHPRPLAQILLLLAVGVFSWTLIEYFLHRFIFHELKLKGQWGELTSAFHLSHHRAVASNEADIVITRPAGSLPFAVFFYFFFSLVFWSFSAAALVMAGAFAGYLFYEYVHYAAHHFQPNNRLSHFLKHYHFQHHFRSPQRRFGVTSPFWDLIFGTYKI